MSFKEIFKLVLGWRLLIILISLPAMLLLTPRTRFTNLTEKPSIANVFSMWSNFDGTRYLDLAEFGYGNKHRLESDFVFFPLYPLSIRTINIFNDYLMSGLLISHLALLLAIYFLFRLFVLDLKTKLARSAIYLLLLFPTAFFLGSVYPDSIFLLLTVLSFYFARKKSFLLAGLSAALASATGITGLFLWPALIYEFWLAYGNKLLSFPRRWESIKYLPKVISLLLPPLGLLFFLRFQIIKLSLGFFPALLNSTFNGRSVDKIVLIHQVFFRYIKMLIFTDHLDPLFFTIALEFICAIGLFFVLIFSFKKIRFSYWLFTLLTFLLPSFSGSFMNLPRYTLAMFPVFIFLAGWLERQHPFVRLSYYSICIIGTIFSITFFTRGYFIG